MEAGIRSALLAIRLAKDVLCRVVGGITLLVAKLVSTFANLTIRVEDMVEFNRTTIYLSGAATFMRLPKLAAVLDQVRPGTELHVHFDELTYIDHSCLDLLMSWRQQHLATGGELYINWKQMQARLQNKPSASE